ncbi:MAG: hypothetical protein HYY36_00365 [Gammaproteobacteria bacterium]|nr:hypothetical protein [Gammaproteobacteria bacterium]
MSLARIARRLGKPIKAVAPEVMNWFVTQDWPGNVRDLQNAVERFAILCEGDTLGSETLPAQVAVAAIAALVNPGEAPPAGTPPTLADMERSYIISVLRSTGGVLEGARGAARILNLKPGTARSRIKKLGISKRDYLP